VENGARGFTQTWPADRSIDPEHADRIRELLESNRYISQKTLSSRLNLHHDPVHQILAEDFGLCNVCFKWIPHSLTKSHNPERVRISMELFRVLEEFSPQKLAHVLIGDESWLNLGDARNSMWLASGVPRPTRVRRNIGVRKGRF
jgi:hypothetical protein